MKRRIPYIWVCLLINVFSSQAGYIDYPYVGKQSVENYVITMIDCGETYLDVYFWCKDIRNKRRYFSMHTYLILPNGCKCQISSLNGKALDSDNLYVNTHKGNEYRFWIRFPVSLKNIDRFSIVDEDIDGMAFIDIKLFSDKQRYMDKCQKIDAYFKRESVEKDLKYRRRKLKKNPKFNLDVYD